MLNALKEITVAVAAGVVTVGLVFVVIRLALVLAG